MTETSILCDGPPSKYPHLFSWGCNLNQSSHKEVVDEEAMHHPSPDYLDSHNLNKRSSTSLIHQLAALEKDRLFMQQQHKQIINGLQAEIENLRCCNKELEAKFFYGKASTSNSQIVSKNYVMHSIGSRRESKEVDQKEEQETKCRNLEKEIAKFKANEQKLKQIIEKLLSKNKESKENASILKCNAEGTSVKELPLEQSTSVDKVHNTSLPQAQYMDINIRFKPLQIQYVNQSENAYKKPSINECEKIIVAMHEKLTELEDEVTSLQNMKYKTQFQTGKFLTPRASNRPFPECVLHKNYTKSAAQKYADNPFNSISAESSSLCRNRLAPLRYTLNSLPAAETSVSLIGLVRQTPKGKHLVAQSGHNRDEKAAKVNSSLPPLKSNVECAAERQKKIAEMQKSRPGMNSKNYQL